MVAIPRGMGSRLAAGLGSRKSIKSQMKQVKISDLGDDFSLAPTTMIDPPKSALPPFARGTYMQRLKTSFFLACMPVQDWFRFYVTIYQFQKSNKPADKSRPVKKWWKTPYYLSERYFIARRIHKELYSAVALGDKATIRRLACQGLNRQLTVKADHKIMNGGGTDKWTVQYRGWTPEWQEGKQKGFLKWLPQALIPPRFKSTRIVSDKYYPLPIPEQDAYIRQITAQIKTKQKLEKSDGTVIEGEKSEYVVIQQMTVNGQDQPWKVWGTVTPSTKTDVEDFMTQATGASQKLSQGIKERAAKLMPNSPMA